MFPDHKRTVIVTTRLHPNTHESTVQWYEGATYVIMGPKFVSIEFGPESNNWLHIASDLVTDLREEPVKPVAPSPAERIVENARKALADRPRGGAEYWVENLRAALYPTPEGGHVTPEGGQS